MNKEYILQFIQTVSEMIHNFADETPQLGRMYALPNGHIDLNEVSYSVSIFGEQVDGGMVITMDRRTAMNLAGKLLNRRTAYLCCDSKSALSEMTNVISAGAIRRLAGKGLVCDISTPRLYEGKNLRLPIKPGAKAIVIPMTLSSGSFDMNLALRAIK